MASRPTSICGRATSCWCHDRPRSRPVAPPEVDRPPDLRGAGLRDRGAGDLAAQHLSLDRHAPDRAAAGAGGVRAADGDGRGRDAAAEHQPGDLQPLQPGDADHALQPLPPAAQPAVARRPHRADAQRHHPRDEVRHLGRRRTEDGRVHRQLPRQRSHHGGRGHQHPGQPVHRGEPQDPRSAGHRHRRLPARAARGDHAAARRAGAPRERVQPALHGGAAPADGVEPGGHRAAQQPAAAEQRSPDADRGPP